MTILNSKEGVGLGAQVLQETLKQLEAKRKKGELTPKEFYMKLLELLTDLKNALVDEDISEAEIRKQIPLILTFLKAQIKALQAREN